MTRLDWSKKQKRYAVKNVYEQKDYSFRQKLMADVLERAQNGEKTPIPRRPDLPKNIAPEPRPDKAQALAAHRSRFPDSYTLELVGTDAHPSTAIIKVFHDNRRRVDDHNKIREEKHTVTSEEKILHLKEVVMKNVSEITDVELDSEDEDQEYVTLKEPDARTVPEM
uniref:Uncharacterized protein n=1 Tax=Branchiostoma floridae TaxID=7739 RepID=C3ZUN0_BRAFL|eukprot:XP_002587731.1 hypothetical protein BRAFLDRAFT_94634 [Branchiostoma floridae]